MISGLAYSTLPACTTSQQAGHSGTSATRAVRKAILAHTVSRGNSAAAGLLVIAVFMIYTVEFYCIGA